MESILFFINSLKKDELAITINLLRITNKNSSLGQLWVQKLTYCNVVNQSTKFIGKTNQQKQKRFKMPYANFNFENCLTFYMGLSSEARFIFDHFNWISWFTFIASFTFR